jgi:hypothetical protein
VSQSVGDPKKEDSKCGCGASGRGGNGQEQNVLQASLTKQDADSDAKAKQDALNANVPFSLSGGWSPSGGGDNSASQTATNSATSNAPNSSETTQSADVSQLLGGSKDGSKCGCGGHESGLGGSGQEQNVLQIGLTKQHADSDAKSKQKLINADVPVSVWLGKQRKAKRE